MNLCDIIFITKLFSVVFDLFLVLESLWWQQEVAGLCEVTSCDLGAHFVFPLRLFITRVDHNAQFWNILQSFILKKQIREKAEKMFRVIFLSNLIQLNKK